jgi:ABC-type multidrug transport system fused ATPase/permease subunit
MANTTVMVESLVRVEELLATPPPARGGTRELEDFRGTVAAEGVCFAYRDVPVLSEVDFDITAGEHVALAVPTGSGKSTLVNLLLGLYKPDAGWVKADGVALDELDLVALRRRIGVVLQDAVILHGTVRDNIAYGRADATEAEIREAARQAGADTFIERLPGGYDAAVGDEGALLAGGQRQRIALARALLGRPALLVLDEPTTHLDHAAIGVLLRELAILPAAVIMVTHDMEVAAQADRVVHLRDGRVARVERGARARPGTIAI